MLECDSADVLCEWSLAGEEGVDVEEEGAEVQLPVSVRNDDGDPVPRRAVFGPGPPPWNMNKFSIMYFFLVYNFTCSG